MARLRPRMVIVLAGLCALAAAVASYALLSNTAPRFGAPCPVAAHHDPAGMPAGPVSAEFVRRGLASIPRNPQLTQGPATAIAENRHEDHGVLTCTAAWAQAPLSGRAPATEVQRWYRAALAAAGWHVVSGPADSPPDAQIEFFKQEYARGRRETVVVSYGKAPRGAPAPLADDSSGSIYYSVFPSPCDGVSECGYQPGPVFGA